MGEDVFQGIGFVLGPLGHAAHDRVEIDHVASYLLPEAALDFVGNEARLNDVVKFASALAA